MRFFLKALLAFLTTFIALLLLHVPLLRLPYFWDEAGYYIPAALDFYRAWLLIPKTTLPVGHPPLVTVYLGLVWRLFGYSVWAARAAMTLIAAATITSLYALGRRVASREIAAWSALLLALSPLFFAQNFKTPTLLVGDDPQARELYFALKARSVECALLRLPEDGKPGTEVLELESEIGWFERWSKPI